MNLIKASIDRPIAVVSAVIMVVLFGWLALQTIPIQLAPDVNRPVITRIDAPDEAWQQYHQTVIDSADAYAQDHPDADYRHLAAAWMEDFERDRQHLTWSVWVARKT